jgi:hypothetical protein
MIDSGVRDSDNLRCEGCRDAADRWILRVARERDSADRIARLRLSDDLRRKTGACWIRDSGHGQKNLKWRKPERVIASRVDTKPSSAHWRARGRWMVECEGD